MTFQELTQIITAHPQRYNRRLIAIDGGGGAGKSTCATYLQQSIQDSYIVHIDDFYRPPQLRVPVLHLDTINPNFDWDRFHTTILDATKNNEAITYQLYDFEAGTLSGNIIEIPQRATVIVEGVWSMQSAFVDMYDYCIWLEAPSDIRLERGVSRDGEEFRHVWEREWIPIDDSYKNTQTPHLKAQCIIDSVRSDFQKNNIVLFSE